MFPGGGTWGWWSEECPARGVLLVHMHDKDSTVPYNVCSYCLQSGPPPPFEVKKVAPPLDVATRLAQMGLGPNAHLIDPDTIPLEPQMLEGSGGERHEKFEPVYLPHHLKMRLLFQKWRSSVIDP